MLTGANPRKRQRKDAAAAAAGPSLRDGARGANGAGANGAGAVRAAAAVCSPSGHQTQRAAGQVLSPPDSGDEDEGGRPSASVLFGLTISDAPRTQFFLQTGWRRAVTVRRSTEWSAAQRAQVSFPYITLRLCTNVWSSKRYACIHTSRAGPPVAVATATANVELDEGAQSVTLASQQPCMCREVSLS